MDGDPGFSGQSLSFLKEKVKERGSDNPLYLALMFDEMSLHQHLQFNGKEFDGTVGESI